MSLKLITVLLLSLSLGVIGNETEPSVVLAEPSSAEVVPNNAEPVTLIPSGRIVGGFRANIADVNYQVSVQMKSNRIFRHFCGGSIVSPTFVVSAAHCFYDVKGLEFAVRAGSNFSNYGGQFIGVRTIDIHPQFNSYTVDFDVAVLKLNSALEFNPNVQPIQLAPAGEPVQPNTYGTISGWGVTYAGGYLSAQLLRTSVPIVAKSRCQQVYGELTKNMFCAGFMDEGGRDSCQGDSGGPLVQTISGKKVLNGIVSWGYGCAKPGNPGVYAQVSTLRTWIDSKISFKNKH